MLDHYPTNDEERVSFWRGQIALAQEWADPYMKAGARVVKLYNNIPHGLREKDLEDMGPDNVQRVKGSMVFAWVDQSKANMLDRNPEFMVGPENAASVDGTDVVQRQANYWYDHTKQIEQDDMMALDAFLLPYAIKKLGWNAVVENQGDLFVTDASTIVIDDPDMENNAIMIGTITRPTVWQDHEAHIEAHMVLLQTPSLHPEIVEITEEHIRHHEALTDMEQPAVDTRIKWEAPFGNRWAPDDFVMDPFAGMSMRDARWLAFRIRAPLYWWKRQPTFKNTRDLASRHRLSHIGEKEWRKAQNSSFNDFAMLEGWEIWARDFPVSGNKNRHLLITIAEGHNKLLRHDEEWPYKFLNDYPAVMLKFQDNVKTWLNKPVLALAGADNIQQLVNEFFDSALYTMRKSKNMWLYDSDLMSKDEFDQVINAPGESAYGVPGLSTKQGPPVIPLPFFDVQSDKQNFIGQIMNFFDRTAGTPQPQSSITAETATESSIIEKRNSAREDARVQRFEHMQIETAEKFWQLHQQFLPERQFLIDPRTWRFAEVTEEVAKGQYQFRIEVSPRRQAKAVERKNWLDLYNILVGSIPAHLQLGMPPPNIVKALELLLRRGFDIRDPETLLPASESEFEQNIRDVMDDPLRLAQTVEAFKTLSGGGDFGPLGGNQSLNPQQLSQSPNTAGRQGEAAVRSEGGGQ